MAHRRWIQTDEQLLGKLRSLYCRLGRLTVRDVLAEPRYPMPTTYRLRFGSFIRACELAGYIRPKIAYASIHPTLLYRACDLLEDAAEAIRASGGHVDASELDRTLMIDARYRLGATMVRPVSYEKHVTWRIRLRRGFDIDGLLVALLDRFDSLVGYALLPEQRFGATRDVFISQSRSRVANNRFSALSELYDRVRN